ncbi:hypothetical protein EYF80_034913 [Liparis tanakae]|uniref:Uncharacterized protein n=1 Tax=Liparis tanakae TaxID=230148 RepID=A0A4Z2GQ36_9TELE|nr:hypothetical protein EYF80_034913 [Liparis tanakae]
MIVFAETSLRLASIQHPASSCPPRHRPVDLAQNWQPAGVIRVSAPLARRRARTISKNQAGTCCVRTEDAPALEIYSVQVEEVSPSMWTLS